MAWTLNLTQPSYFLDHMPQLALKFSIYTYMYVCKYMYKEGSSF